jgi:hypothetical protein
VIVVLVLFACVGASILASHILPGQVIWNINV